MKMLRGIIWRDDFYQIRIFLSIFPWGGGGQEISMGKFSMG